METRVNDVEKEGALHALLITLADASATFKQMQGHAGDRDPLLGNGRCPTCYRCSADKQLTSRTGASDLIMLHR